VGASLRWWSRRSTPLVERWIKRKLFVTEEPDADARAIPNAATEAPFAADRMKTQQRVAARMQHA
jgi:hypothetical protein